MQPSYDSVGISRCWPRPQGGGGQRLLVLIPVEHVALVVGILVRDQVLPASSGCQSGTVTFSVLVADGIMNMNVRMKNRVTFCRPSRPRFPRRT